MGLREQEEIMEYLDINQDHIIKINKIINGVFLFGVIVGFVLNSIKVPPYGTGKAIVWLLLGGHCIISFISLFSTH